MAIKKIKISNFKSFQECEVELGSFNVVIGANASGKSNFLGIFEFLRDITSYGLDNAISMQGGTEYLRNINIGSSEHLVVEVTSDSKYRQLVETVKEGFIEFEANKVIYTFEMEFNLKGRGFSIAKETFVAKGSLFQIKRRKQKGELFIIEGHGEKLGDAEITVSNLKGGVRTSYKLPDGIQLEEDGMPPFLRGKLPPKTSLLSSPRHYIPVLFEHISIYDFDPKLARKAIPITGKAELEEDGGNLAIVLKSILESREKKRRLSNLVRDVLPFVDDLDVERFLDRSLLFKIREIYAKEHYLPASLVSDGTINVTALILALFFEKKSLTIIEEPDRNVHPYLISKLTALIKDASQKKQIIVTTHNPEMIKHVEPDDILCVSRDEAGFSTIFRPVKTEDVKRFLKDGIGIDELYVQNLLRPQVEHGI